MPSPSACYNVLGDCGLTRKAQDLGEKSEPTNFCYKNLGNSASRLPISSAFNSLIFQGGREDNDVGSL